MKSKTHNGTEKSPEQIEEEIRLMAYYLWEKKGSNNGADIEDWIEAETFLKN
ncbi:MAG: DUF2934 domain-containing protein [Chlorobiaceae bacterium]|nr:DUF2934 domain-containing protein [Chlorobiaceae bacterium]NTW10152.1 DUF2934 domain-containing protein [Chlorobiaceae bacterium]